MLCWAPCGVRTSILSSWPLILHTHAHWDHCGGTKELKQTTGAPAAVHHAEAERMRRGNNGVLRPTAPMSALLRPFLDWPFPGVEPDLLLGDDTDLRPFGVEGRVVLTPGHTAGSVSVLTPDREAIVGDLLMGATPGAGSSPGIRHSTTTPKTSHRVRGERSEAARSGSRNGVPRTRRPMRADAVRKRFGEWLGGAARRLNTLFLECRPLRAGWTDVPALSIPPAEKVPYFTAVVSDTRGSLPEARPRSVGD